MKKNILFFLLVPLSLIAFPSLTYAHVVVRPAEVGVGAFQTFSIGVPVEKDSATVAMRLEIPQGMKHVTPNIKPGWEIEVKKAEDGETVTEIVWSNSSIQPGFRDEFLFSAQVPAEAATLQWKAYQTYEDGSVVAWDQDPTIEQPKDREGNADFSKTGPLSKTEVINDLREEEKEVESSPPTSSAPLLSWIAIGMSAAALGSKLVGK